MRAASLHQFLADVDDPHHQCHHHRTKMTRTTALAAAGGYCIAWISVASADTIDALWPPLICLTVKKSPMTWVKTRIEPSAIPVFDSGMITSTMMRQRLAPASRAASISAGSILASELAIGPTISSVNRFT